VLRIGARSLERRLNADHSDRVPVAVLCGCGEQARYVDRRRKTFTTALGDITLGRAYYHCAVCGRGFCPRDLANNMDNTSCSPAIIRMIGLTGATLSFEEGSELLRELAGVQLPAKRVEREAEALGEEIAMDERTVISPAEVVPSTLYLGMDGTGIPMRTAELAGRTGKQTDGSAKTREVKLCVVWSAETRDQDGLPVRDENSVSYSAAIESAAIRDTDPGVSVFAQRVLRETERRGFDRAQRQVILGDGALWIWNLAHEHFPDAIQIVDRFHALENLGRAATAIWGPQPGTDVGKNWRRERHDQLDQGQLRAIVRELRRWSAEHPEARRCIDYIYRNRRRMRYPAFRRRGLCTSTGVVEAGCKVTVTRLKRAGMHWTLLGANAIIALRCAKLSTRLDGFLRRRQLQRAA
jgi:hypothetical protein